MSHVLLRPCWSLTAGPLALLLAFLVCARPAHAQQTPSKEPSTRDHARQLEKDLKEAEEYDPSTRKVVRLFKSWVGAVIIAMVVVPLVIAFKVGIWLLSRMSATTDAEKIAMSDPWVRAQLARQKAQGNAPPTQGQ